MVSLVPWENDRSCASEDALGPIELGLQVDQPAARQKYFLVTSVIEIEPTCGLFSKPIEDPEKLLAQIAAEARRAIKNRKDDLVKEYERISKTKKTGGKLPTTLCVMYTPSKLFISSSVRKSPAASWTNAIKSSEFAGLGMLREWDTFVVKALKESALFDEGEVRHQTKANCAEMLCLHLWSLCQTSKLEDLDFCLFVTVWFDSEVGDVRIKRPCTGEGCEKVLEGLQRDYGVKFVKELSIPEGNSQMDILGQRHHYSILPRGTDMSGWGENGLYQEPKIGLVRGRPIHLDMQDERLQPKQRELYVMGQDLERTLDEDDDEDAFWVPEIPASEALKMKVCPDA